MTPEQFVYWLSGYLTAYQIESQEENDLVNAIKEVINNVKNSHNQAVLFTGYQP